MVIRGWAGIRRAGWGAVCALALTCASVPARSQDAAAATTATPKKPTTATNPKTTAPTHHATAAASSGSGAKKSTSSTASAKKPSSRKKKSVRTRGQQKIDSERATAIQEALIRAHYLTGEPKGTWNQASEDAMRRYQADNGWQSKQVPDSRALIKLGLGPSKDHLLNPESAMTTVPDAPRAESRPPTSQTSAPVSSTPAPGASQNEPSRPQ